ncbi:MAG TPA: MBL fold metallo-hydrolase [Burkholderiaceae bacterium]|nr:MBL fold metallo-hydrolase [Burkholderiaceae bacterium]
MRHEAIRIEALPASYGDCLLVSCALSRGGVWRLLVDTGPGKTWPALRQRLTELPVDAAGRRRIDLLVISHIDHDHIGGISRLLADDELKIDYGDIWFNAPRVRGVAEGQRLAEALSLPKASRPWNLAFDRGFVAMPADDQPVQFQTESGPVITLLSPTPERLDALFAVWGAELAKLRRGESDPVEPVAVERGHKPRSAASLEELAARRTKLDTAKANGSSIAFLLEHRGASVLLAADAFATVLGSALRALKASRSQTGPLPIDAFKLSHHGSSANVTTELLAEVDARHCIVSTDNKHFDHPDDEAMARVLLGQPRAAIWFNHDTPRNRRWSESALMNGRRRQVNYPVAPQAGITLSLKARARTI